jgi:hypothetical protein
LVGRPSRQQKRFEQLKRKKKMEEMSTATTTTTRQRRTSKGPPKFHEIAGLTENKWLFMCFVIATLIIVALLFAIFAWNDAQPNRPHLSLRRQNVVVHGTLSVDERAEFASSVSVGHLSYDSLSYGRLKILNQTGPFELSTCWSNYRIDTAGTHTIKLVLPYASQAPGHIYNVFLSEIGANNTIQFNVQGGDLACDADGCTNVNPGYEMPSTSASPDYVQIINDSQNAWHFIAHTKSPA